MQIIAVPLKELNETPTLGSLQIFSPGRLNIIGEHTDYNGGKVLPICIEQGLTLTLRKLPLHTGPAFLYNHAEALLIFSSEQNPEQTVVLNYSTLQTVVDAYDKAWRDGREVALPASFQGSWARYVIGAAAAFFSNFRDSLSLAKDHTAIHISSTLPAGGGLSSSAALCCGVISALSLQWGAMIPAKQIAWLAMTVEHTFPGTKCGLMDQLAIMLGRENHFLKVDFNSFPKEGRFNTEAIQSHKAFSDYHIVAFETGVTHSLADSEYNQRRLTCEQSLILLQRATHSHHMSLGAYSDQNVYKKSFQHTQSAHNQKDLKVLLQAMFDEVEPGVSPLLAKRAAHAIFENVRVREAVSALKTGKTADLDRAMRESHWSLRNHYEVSCTELDTACQIATDVANSLAHSSHLKSLPILGSRMTGGGFGGSTVQFVHNGILEEFKETFTDPNNPYTRITGKMPKLLITNPKDGLRANPL